MNHFLLVGQDAILNINIPVAIVQNGCGYINKSLNALWVIVNQTLFNRHVVWVVMPNTKALIINNNRHCSVAADDIIHPTSPQKQGWCSR